MTSQPYNMNKRVVIVIVGIIVIVLISIFLQKKFISMKELPPVKEKKEQVRTVLAGIVEYNVVVSEVAASGRVVSSSEVPLVSEAAGRIEQADVVLKTGASFKKGDVLFSIYKDEAELALAASKSQFLKSLATVLPQIKIDFVSAYSQFEVFFKAIDLEKDLPKLPSLTDVRLKTFIASRGILSEYYTILQSQLKLQRYSVVAPFDGVFLQIISEVGTYVNAGNTIGKIIKTGEVEVEIPVEKRYASFVAIGDTVKLQRQKEGPFIFGYVVRKTAFLDEETQSVGIYVKVITDGENPLLRGEYLYGIFEGHQVDNGFEIPRNAIFNFNNVFIVVDSRLKKAEINVIKLNNTTAIIDGIPVGTTLVLEPLVTLQENALVNIRVNKEK